MSGNGIVSWPPTYSSGGIQPRSWTLVLRNSRVIGNGAEFSAAGIGNGAGCSLTLIDSVVSQNRITYEGGGGGISNWGTIILVSSTVSGTARTLEAASATVGLPRLSAAPFQEMHAQRLRLWRGRYRKVAV